VIKLLAMIALAISPVSGQAPSFEVASVRSASAPVQTGGSTGFRESIDPQQVRYSFVTLQFLITRAYAIKNYQISGPGWLDTEHFDVVARLPNGATREQVPAMLQALLAERFRMVVHWEDRRQPVYALVVGRDGSRLKASSQGGESNKGPGASGPALTFSPQGHIELIRTTLGRFADTLTSFVGSPVVDMTGIQGEFNITLDVSMKDLPALQSMVRVGQDQELPDSPESASLFSAVRELGLKLEARRAPIRHLVVDSAAKVPTEN
jgi:uncharacterized protein (TIGR03435 family)